MKLTTQPLSPVGANGPAGDPFSGTPAGGWADGAAGNLDWPTLRGGKPTAFADLLTKEQRATFLAGLRTGALNKDGTQKNTRTWVTSFAPEIRPGGCG